MTTSGVRRRIAELLCFETADTNGAIASLLAITLTDANGNPQTLPGGSLPSSPITGQQTLTTSAVALASHVLVNGLTVTALASNTGTVYVGPSGVTSGTGYPLSAGQSMSFAVSNSNGIFILGTNTSDKIAFAGN